MTELVGHYKAVVKVLVPCPLLILRLLASPTGQLVNHCACKGNSPAGILCLGRAEHDFRFAFTFVGFIFGKSVNGAPDMKLRCGKINVLPLQRQQFTHAQAGA